MTSSEDLVAEIARVAKRDKLRIVTSESLTSGNLAAWLGKGPDAANWFGGGVIAYHEAVKFGALGVDEGQVVTRICAEQMARGAIDLLRADVAVSTTGVGGLTRMRANRPARSSSPWRRLIRRSRVNCTSTVPPTKC